jgi:hypothetical protein
MSTDLPPISSRVARFVCHAQLRIREPPGGGLVTGRQLQGVGPVIRDRTILERQNPPDRRETGSASTESAWRIRRTLFASDRNSRLSGRNHCGEERTDRRTENRPSLPRGHHSTTTIVSTIERAVRFRSAAFLGESLGARHGALAGARDLFAGGGNSKNRFASQRFTAPSSCPVATNVKIGSSPDRSCLCKFSLPGNISIRLLDLLSRNKPSIGTSSEKVLATDRFQYATSKDARFCSARRTDEREVHLWRIEFR